MSDPRERPVVWITGASGLIGTRVAHELAPDYRVVGIDVHEPDGFPDDARYFACDLTSAEETRRAVQRIRDHVGDGVASVIHLAAHYDFSGAPSPLYQTLTVEGTRRLLRALHAEQIRAEQFVFSSSLLVMKPASDDSALDESSPVQAEWDYPQSKLDAEAVLRQEHGELPVVVLRIAGVYDEAGHSPPIAQQIWRIRERKLESFFFPGNRSHGQSFVHLDDVARCLRAVVERRAELEPYEIFLVGEPELLSYGELQDRIGAQLHGHDWPTVRIPAPVAKAGAWLKEKLPLGEEEEFIKPWMIDLADAHYPVSIERARRRLRWQPRHTLAETLPRMLARLERDPRAFYRENGLPLEDEDAGEDGDGDG